MSARTSIRRGRIAGSSALCAALAAAFAAEAAAQELPAGGRAGFLPQQGFIVGSADERYTLRIGLHAGYKFEPFWVNGESQNRKAFLVMRPIWAGNIFKPWITFWTSMELAANPPFLLDARVTVRPVPELGVTMGQQVTPFCRHQALPVGYILFPDWDQAASYFWTGRDKGVTVFGTLARRLDYYLGFYGASPLRQFTTLAGNYLLNGRLTFSPLGPALETEYPYIATGGRTPFRVSMTAEGYYGNIQLANENFNPATFQFETVPTGVANKKGAAGVDLLLQGWRLAFFGEGFWRRTDPSGGPSFESWGAWGQVGFLLIERWLDVAVRVSWINPSTSLSRDMYSSIEGQFAYYIDPPRLVLKLRYAHAHQQNPGTTLPPGVTLPSSNTGNLDVLTFQLSLMF